MAGIDDLSDEDLAAEVEKRKKAGAGGGRRVRVWELVGDDAKRAIDLLGLGGDDDDKGDGGKGDGGKGDGDGNRRGFFS